MRSIVQTQRWRGRGDGGGEEGDVIFFDFFM